MKRLLVSALVALSLPLVAPTSSASAATSSCSKVGSTKTVSGTKFTCRLVSKKRVWVKVAAGKSTTSTTVPKGPAPTVSPDTAFASTSECKLKSFETPNTLGFPRPSFRGSWTNPRALVIPVQFSDTGSNGRNYQEMVDMMKKQSDFYRAQSLGRLNLNFVWTPTDAATKKPTILKVPYSAVEEGLVGICDKCDRTELMTRILSHTPVSWDLSSYETIIAMLDDRRISVVGVAFRAAAEYPNVNGAWNKPIPSPSGLVYSSMITTPSLIPHEMGHSLLGFIDLYDFSAPARDFTKGWDIMGTGSTGQQSDSFFAWHKWISGWFDDPQVDCVTKAGTTVHYLDDLDTANSLNKMVVVRKNATTAIVAEVRTERVVIYRVLMDVWGGSGPIITNDATTFKVNPKVGDTVTESGVSFKILDCRSGGCSVEVTNPAA
jgi:hypothetical protein